MNRIRTAAVAALLASFVGLQPAAAMDDQGRGWDRSREVHARDEARREARRDVREERWDAARAYRYDRHYRPQRLTRYDRIYRGSDNRYYCQRDNGTTGLIIGGVAGAVLGNVIAPGGSKVLGSIIGGGAGALIGKAIDDGDMVCR